jgi:nucleoside-diphosphate-sugar epimerase
MEKKVVTITGINEFLGSQVCLYFLKDGTYKVRAIVKTNQSFAAKLEL